MILYKPWTKVLLQIRKFDWFIWSVSWTQKRDVIDWIDDLRFASELKADIGKKKCGIEVVKVAFCINPPPMTLMWIITLYQNIQYISKK